MDENEGGLEASEGTSGADALIRCASELPVTGVQVDFYVTAKSFEDFDNRRAELFIGGVGIEVLPPSAESQKVT